MSSLRPLVSITCWRSCGSTVSRNQNDFVAVKGFNTVREPPFHACDAARNFDTTLPLRIAQNLDGRAGFLAGLQKFGQGTEAAPDFVGIPLAAES